VHYVLRLAVADLARLAGTACPAAPVVVDIGCGWGQSFRLLADTFAPSRLIGCDISAEVLARAAAETTRHGLAVEYHQADSAALPLADASVDLVFCHQTFHHLVDQHGAMAEFHRVLKPGGLLLFAESTRAYIHSWIIRLLFRHPMEVQKTAEEYLALIAAAGFEVTPARTSYPYLWWSRTDLGIGEYWLGRKPRAGHVETLVNTVAIRR
jgi:ubiquinone/menaquinone biosynthesis C-methylase UbiE